MLDLTKLPSYYIEKYGRERVAEIIEQSANVVAMWEKAGNFRLNAVQKLLDFDPEPISEIRPLYENPPTGTKLAIVMPLIGCPEPKSVDCLMRLYDKREMRYHRVAFNNLSVARNALAAWALREGFEWVYWRDGDMMEPCGDAAFFKRETGLLDLPDQFAGINTIYRLLHHRVKAGRADATMVSVSYPSRNNHATPQFGGGDTQSSRSEVRRGPRVTELKEVPWCGFGGVLTHRSVFEDIIRTQGDEIRMAPGGVGQRFGYEYAMFSSTDHNTPGDDIPFCIRARRAGHKIFVDLAVHAAHIGDRPYTYKDV
jgi:hypothetical protein